MRKADGWTALYDAMGVYLNGAQDQDGQKILVLYTDGGDTRSSLTFRDALDLLKASDVTVYAVGYLEHQSSSGRAQQRMELDRFATMTGGQAYFPVAGRDLDGDLRPDTEGDRRAILARLRVVRSSHRWGLAIGRNQAPSGRSEGRPSAHPFRLLRALQGHSLTGAADRLPPVPLWYDRLLT